MNIEDLLLRAACVGNYRGLTPVRLGSPHWMPVNTLADQIANEIAFTEKQSQYAVKLLTRYKTQLNTLVGHDISEYLLTPHYRLGIRNINSMKTIKIFENDNHITVQFPYDLSLVNKIKQYKSTVASSPISYNEIVWDDDSWKFSLKEENIKYIAEHLLPDGFTACNTFINYLAQINEIEKNTLAYIPYVAFENNKFIYKNVSKSVTQPSSTNLLQVLFDSARAGICVRDDAVMKMISALEDPITLSIVDSIGSMASVPNTMAIECLGPTITYSSRVMIVIPGGNELVSIKTFMEFFANHGISNSKIAVMFRLGNTTEAGKEFNEYVKVNSLNNKMSSDIAVVFVMGKLPTPLLTEEYEFDVVINLGTTTPHYILRSYITLHPCVINYNIVNKSGELNFGNM
jgi:hypothetical protein